MSADGTRLDEWGRTPFADTDERIDADTDLYDVQPALAPRSGFHCPGCGHLREYETPVAGVCQFCRLMRRAQAEADAEHEARTPIERWQDEQENIDRRSPWSGEST